MKSAFQVTHESGKCYKFLTLKDALVNAKGDDVWAITFKLRTGETVKLVKFTPCGFGGEKMFVLESAG